MKPHLDRYFELFPLLAIIIILIAGEMRQNRVPAPLAFERPVFDYPVPSIEVQTPRILFR